MAEAKEPEVYGTYVDEDEAKPSAQQPTVIYIEGQKPSYAGWVIGLIIIVIIVVAIWWVVSSVQSATDWWKFWEVVRGGLM